MRILTARVIWSLVAITILKVVVFLALNSAGRVVPFVGDNAVDHYIPAAHRLLDEGRFNGPDSRLDSKVPPGYSLILAATMAFAPERYQVITVSLQMIADLVTALVLFWIGRTFVGVLQGAVAGVVWLLYPPEVALSTWITAETIFTTIFLAAVAVVLSSLAKRSRGSAFVAGVLIGAATLLRGTTIGLAFLFVPLALWRRAYGWAAFVLIGFTLVIAPWAIRNRFVLQDPIVVAVGFGGAFMQGADDRVFTIDGKHAFFPELYDSAARAGIAKPATDHEGDIDSWLFAVGLHRYAERLKNDPWSYLPFLTRKALSLWFGTETGSFRGELILALCSLPVVLLGLIQVWRWALAGTMFGAVVAIVCGYFIALHMATAPLNRYMLPIYPLLALGAATWIVALADTRLRARRWEPAPRREIPA